MAGGSKSHNLSNKSAPKYFDDVASTLPDSVHVETAPSLDLDPLNTRDGGNHQVPHNTNSGLVLTQGGWGANPPQSVRNQMEIGFPPIHNPKTNILRAALPPP